MNLRTIEHELKKRLDHPYQWRRKQNNDFDSQTRYIYRLQNFEELLKTIEVQHPNDPQKDYFNYTLNRWYNFWSAKAIEKIFCQAINVEAEKNPYHKQKDFSIDNLSFDHKTSVFPKAYPTPFGHTQQNPKDLLKWLYQHQSQQGRKHLENRLFIILYNESNQEHWKLKSEIQWLKILIENYLKNFDKNKLQTFHFLPNKVTYADAIFAVKKSSIKKAMPQNET